MDGMPPKETVHAMLREVVELGLDVGPSCFSELERKYGFNPKILVNEGYLEHDPEIKIHTITKKGLEEIGEKPFVNTEDPEYSMLELIDELGGKMREDYLNDVDKEIILAGAMGGGRVKYNPQKRIYELTAKGRLSLSSGRGEL